MIRLYEVLTMMTSVFFASLVLVGFCWLYFEKFNTRTKYEYSWFLLHLLLLDIAWTYLFLGLFAPYCCSHLYELTADTSQIKPAIVMYLVYLLGCLFLFILRLFYQCWRKLFIIGGSKNVNRSIHVHS